MVRERDTVFYFDDGKCLEYRPRVHFSLQHPKLAADHTVRAACIRVPYHTYDQFFFYGNKILFEIVTCKLRPTSTHV